MVLSKSELTQPKPKGRMAKAPWIKCPGTTGYTALSCFLAVRIVLLIRFFSLPLSGS